MNKPKTVIEWLEVAKAAGLPWAEDAIKNCDCPDDKASSLRIALAQAFVWKDTEHGRDYWHHLYKGLPSDWQPAPGNLWHVQEGGAVVITNGERSITVGNQADAEFLCQILNEREGGL